MKITRRQLRKIIREAMEDFKPRYKGDTPAKQGSISRGGSEQLKVNMGFQSNDPGEGGKLLRVSGGGEKFAITNTGDYFSTSVYDDDFRDAFISKLEQAREQGYTEVQLSSGPMNTENLTIDEMIQRVEEIEASMY